MSNQEKRPQISFRLDKNKATAFKQKLKKNQHSNNEFFAKVVEAYLENKLDIDELDLDDDPTSLPSEQIASMIDEEVAPLKEEIERLKKSNSDLTNKINEVGSDKKTIDDLFSLALKNQGRIDALEGKKPPQRPSNNKNRNKKFR